MMNRAINSMRCTTWVVSIVLGLPVTALADKTLNNVMANIGQVMVQLYPVVVSNRQLTPADRASVTTDVNRLASLFHEAGTYIKQRSETYQVSYILVSKLLSQVQSEIAGGDIEQARFDLYKLGPICTSCHTQDTHLRTLFAGTGRAAFPDDRSFAEFNYLTRNYSEAEHYFDRYLKADVARTEFELVQPLQRLVTIYAQVLNRPGDGAIALSRYLSVKGHSGYTLKYLRGWISGLEQLDREGAAKIVQPDLKSIEASIQKYIGSLDKPQPTSITPEQEVSRVWLRGRLYHYLNTKPDRTEIPKVLYWLAVSDRAIGYDYYFSLADLYLKDCVYSYPTHPYALRCFKSYRDYVTDLYSGAGGSFIPAEISAELTRMEQVLADTK